MTLAQKTYLSKIKKIDRNNNNIKIIKYGLLSLLMLFGITLMVSIVLLIIGAFHLVDTIF